MIYRSKAPLRIGLAGGGTDVTARIIGQKLSEKFGGQPIVIDYRAGASGTVGNAHAAKATPDWRPR